MGDYFEKKDKQRNRDERPSWREMDAKRDGKGGSLGKPRFQTNADKRNEGNAKKALDELFKPKKNSKESAAWQNVKNSRGRAFVEEAKLFIDEFGLPRVWDDLLHLLDLPNHEDVSPVISKIKDRAPSETAGKRELALGKCKVAILTHEDPEIIEELEDLISTLS